MAKLQMIHRANGSHVFSVNIPLALIEVVRFEKGQLLKIESTPDGKGIIITREE